MTFSVIIPTMWKIDSFPHFLQSLAEHNLVDEVIIINNNIKKTPFSLLNHPNIKLLNQSHNIGVNPAWNLGVSKSRGDILCISNDDIEFDFQIFNFLEDKITLDSGMIGIDIHKKSSEMILEPAAERAFGYACLFFINKKNYTFIPDRLKIFYGDDWLFATNKAKGRVNKKIFGFPIKGLISATARDFQQKCATELPIYREELNKFLNEQRS